MITEELIKLIKSKKRKSDIIAYRQSFMLILYKRGVTIHEIARLLDIKPPQVSKSLRVISERLDVRDHYVVKAYYEMTRHGIAILTENVLAKEDGSWRKVVCKSLTIDGINFE